MTTLNMFKFEKHVASFSAGATIMKQGDGPDFAYVIREGEVDVLLNGELLETLDPGTIFGEMALVDDSPRTATVVAKTDVIVVPLDEQAFLRHVSATPFFALQVLRTTVARLRRALESS